MVKSRISEVLQNIMQGIVLLIYILRLWLEKFTFVSPISMNMILRECCLVMVL